MDITSRRVVDDSVIERTFTIGPGEGPSSHPVDGIVWTPITASPTAPAPMILLGHPGGLTAMRPRLEARARQAARDGFAAAAIELPGAGDRPALPDVDRARADLRAALAARVPVPAAVIDRLVLPLVERAVPEWQQTLDVLLALPEIAGPAGISGGVAAIGVRMAWTDPRVRAAGLFAGSYLPAVTFDEARRVTIPVHMLLQWDDVGNDRAASLALFDALGSGEKTLEANLGGHTGVPAHAGQSAAGFFARHLRPE